MPIRKKSRLGVLFRGIRADSSEERGGEATIFIFLLAEGSRN